MNGVGAMGGFTSDNIIVMVVAIILLLLVLKFIKGILKTVITLILVLTLGVTAYNIFIQKKSIGYELNRYKTDYKYVVEMKDISVEAKKSIDEIKENKNVNENVKKLVDLKKRANEVKHSEEATFFHDRYMNGFDTIIVASQGYALAKDVKEQGQKLNELSKALDVKFGQVFLSEN
jgi:hypothetical protein